MKHLKKLIQLAFNLSLIFFLILLSSLNQVFAYEINWTEVANTNNETQFIDTNSIKYYNNNLLSVLTKYSEINPDDNKILNTQSYLLAIDCEKRLFSKLPTNGELKQIKKWDQPINNKLIKKTIINSCAY